MYCILFWGSCYFLDTRFTGIRLQVRVLLKIFRFSKLNCKEKFELKKYRYLIYMYLSINAFFIFNCLCFLESSGVDPDPEPDPQGAETFCRIRIRKRT
jgi:hypothetical protein